MSLAARRAVSDQNNSSHSGAGARERETGQHSHVQQIMEAVNPRAQEKDNYNGFTQGRQILTNRGRTPQSRADKQAGSHGQGRMFDSKLDQKKNYWTCILVHFKIKSMATKLHHQPSCRTKLRVRGRLEFFSPSHPPFLASLPPFQQQIQLSLTECAPLPPGRRRPTAPSQRMSLAARRADPDR